MTRGPPAPADYTNKTFSCWFDDGLMDCRLEDGSCGGSDGGDGSGGGGGGGGGGDVDVQ